MAAPRGALPLPSVPSNRRREHELGVTAETGVGDKKFMTDKTKSEQLLRRDIVLASPSQLCVLGIAFSQSNNRYHRKGEMPRCSQTLLAEPC
jgi:hypothetical protein